MLNLNYNIQLKDIFIYKITDNDQYPKVEIYLNEDINERRLILNKISSTYNYNPILTGEYLFFNSPYYGHCQSLLNFNGDTPMDNAKVNIFNEMIERVYLHYQNSNISYTSIEQFLIDFKRKICENFAKIIDKQYILFNKIYALTDDDIIEREHAININALNDNSKIEKPLDNLAEFVSEQTASKISKNKLNAYVDYMEQMRPSMDEELIRALKPLFFTIIPEYNYIYKGEY